MSGIERKIGRSVIFQLFSFGIAGLVQILFIPFTIAKLGKTLYGIYEIVFSLTLLNALLEIGVGSTITNYIKKYYDRDKKEYRSFFWTYFWFKFFISLVICIICITIALNVEFLYKKVPHVHLPDLKTSIIWFALGAILTNLVSFFDNVQNGFVRYDLTSITNISSKIFFIVSFFIWLFTWNNLSISHFCFITFILVPFFRLLHQVYLVKVKQPEILAKPLGFNSKHITSKFHYLGGLSIITFLGQIYKYGITFILGLIAAPSLVGEFGIIKRIIDLIAGVSDMLVRPIMPASEELLDKYKPQNLIYKMTHIHAIIVLGLTTFLIINGVSLSKYYLNNEYDKFGLHLAIVALPRLLPSAIVMLMLYYGEGKTKINIINKIVQVGLTLSLVLIGYYIWGFEGLLTGLCLGTAIATIVLLSQFLTYYKSIKKGRFFRIYFPILMAVVICILSQFFIEKFLGTTILSIFIWNLWAILVFFIFIKKDILLLYKSYRDKL